MEHLFFTIKNLLCNGKFPWM